MNFSAGAACCPGVDRCVYLQIDSQNCGACGHACPDGDACHDATCAAPVCGENQSCSSADLCCGAACCGAAQICCYDPYGDAVEYPYFCADADAGCAQPCFACL